MCDKLQGEDFEGDPKRSAFSQKEWYYVRNSQAVLLRKIFDEKARNLFIQKQLRMPLQTMTARVKAISEGKDSRNDLRYIMYSGHDTQLVNLIAWFKPKLYTPIDCPYSSSLYLELHYDDVCLTTATDKNSCFTVEAYHNGRILKFDYCLAANKARGSSSMMCQYDDFMAYVNSLSVIENVDKTCMDVFIPYPFENHESFLQ